MSALAQNMNNAPRKVLYVVLDLDLGGLQRVVRLLIERLDRTRFEPYLCCFDRGGMFYDYLTSRGIEGYILHRKPGPLDVKLLLNLYRLIRRKKIDVIHSHNTCGFYAGVAGRLAGVQALIHTDHGRLVPDRQAAIWEDWLVSYLHDAYVGVSNELTEYLAARIGITRPRLKTIINGVDSARFVPKAKSEKNILRTKSGLAPDDLVIGTVCRFDPIKNLSFLVSCMTSIVRQLPKAKLILVGEGTNQLDLEHRIKKLGLSDRVCIWPRRQDVENVLPMFDLYACSSISEGTSMTILEAMACGLPIIASAVGGNRSLVGGSHGVLFQLDNEQGFIDSVLSLLGDTERLQQMGQKSRQRVEIVYPLANMVESYQSLYEKLSPVSCPDQYSEPLPLKFR